MRTTDRVLTVALLAYIIPCCSGFLHKSKKFSGQLTPMDANVCTTQNITFTGELLQSPSLNYSIGFAVKNGNTKYEAVHYDNVTTVNETMSQFTLYNITLDTEDISKPVYVHVKSYYWQKFDDKDDTLQLGKTSTTRIYPLLETVRDFKCIVMNYVSMNCSWNYGKDYGENMPEVIFQWRIPSYSASWTDCRDFNPEYGYCYWAKDSDPGYFKNVNITVRITLKQKCDLNNSTDFHKIDTSKIVKPNPVSSISSKVIDSTCIQVFWNTSDSEPQNPKEHRIIVSSKWDYSTMTFKTSQTTKQFSHSRTFCDLHPYTEYTFSVSIQPIGLYSGFFSDEKKCVSRTFSDIPSASPEVIEGGYYNYNHRDCDESSQERRVCVVWKSIKDEHKNGPMKGVQGLFTAINAKTPPVQEDWAEDSAYGCSFLLCNTHYNFTIKTRNVNGTSENGSTITIPSFNPGNTPPQFIVESTNTSEVYINLDQRDGRHTKEYTVVWCRKQNGHCQSGHDVSWKHFPSNTTEAVLHINSSQDLMYGVSVLTEDGSSGVEWQDCVYLKNIPLKREPQNVVVSAGSDDNTLVVTWDKLTCKSNEPYIAMYNVQFNKLDI
ncbi:leukemia inhibitory factor receptor-like [Mercenaria mercenaria]|uniref:leukemia inhibitory factor receptor-like n=1 Tax=Mercenaria mercenaria TaxID=6596 RepID=UPI00234F9FAC|nr:leukemia inhibitory factor receptor-like [Mercenaria mercenaria]